MSILAIGTVALDSLETPFGKKDLVIGGSATYLSLAASYFTKKINLVAVIGEDFPQEGLQQLKNHGINTDGLQVKKGGKTFFWKGRYHTDMNTRDSLVTELNVLADFDPVIPAHYQDCSILALGNLEPSVQRSVIARLEKRPGLIVMDTMNFWMDTAHDSLLKTLSMVDVLSVNDQEARQLSGEYSLVKAAQHIMGLGPKTVIIKKGENGALLFQGKQVFFAPALPLEEVFDPTGAGDSFAGGFVGWLAKTQDYSFENMKKAIVYGSALASFCVGAFGPENLYNKSENDIKARYGQFLDLMQFEGQL